MYDSFKRLDIIAGIIEQNQQINAIEIGICAKGKSVEARETNLALAINGQLIGEWFKEQFNKLFSSIRQTVTPHRKDKGLRI